MKKNNEILLSLVVCCYNVADYLENMIDGLLNQINNQTQKDSNKIEIILVEDASTDNNKTKKICKKYECNFKNIKLVQHKNNKGLSESRKSAKKKIKQAEKRIKNLEKAKKTIRKNFEQKNNI